MHEYLFFVFRRLDVMNAEASVSPRNNKTSSISGSLHRINREKETGKVPENFIFEGEMI